jgi:pimeloyl-ACP methyl ester carboxylesterase
MAKTAMRDMIILVPGITGSVLVDDAGNEIWNASAGAAWSYIRTLGKCLDKLIVAAHPPGSDASPGVLRASALVKGIHGVFGLGRIDGYRELASMVRDNFDVVPASDDPHIPGNYLEFAYDWRLSNRTSAGTLKTLVDVRLPVWQRSPKGGRDAKVILVTHSMGGLVARYYLEKLEGWANCRALVTFGTPYRGSVDAVDYLANGYKKAFIDFTDAMRSMPSVYELLPIWRVVKDGSVYKRVAEIDAIPRIDPARARDALGFHREIEEAVERHKAIPEYVPNRYHIIPVVGVFQPTLQSVRYDGRSLIGTRELPDWIDAGLEGGDGTVPRVSATPIELSREYRETFFAERHGSLQNNTFSLDDLRERIKQMQATGLGEILGNWSARDIEKRGVISLDLDPLYLSEEPVRLSARLRGGPTTKGGLKARIQPLGGGGPAQEYDFGEGRDGPELVLEGLAPGSYRVRVRSATGGPSAATPVSDLFDVASAI